MAGALFGPRVNWALLFAAGILGGLTGSIAGLASVTTYPALLLFGLAPVTANVTNTVALVFNGIGSVLGSRPELEGQGRWIRRTLPVAVLGGAAGAALLLSTPAEGFEKAVPILLGVASLAILLPRRISTEAQVASHLRHRTGVLFEVSAIFLICVYGGYFGAAAGVLLLALLLRAAPASLPQANAGKNVVLGVANTVAAVIFALLAPVHWWAALVLGLGCLVGSRLGPIVVRHAPAGPLRVVIGAAGVALAVKLGIDAYGS
ncbi:MULTISPECIES: sulfite exporter TauE/SafE family protein [unclassified Mycobacterium]|uniref:sulfite exporter TauE/SafE family protein n=1 Tax=unclassified Mycobacterium TaxID=2642494 RepID=UPI0007402861|nr:MULTISPECIES: sulfite exporter TauE/SafE family protein [unclassified Mycobacterium]KUH82838.1 transporter [Mycobacterium sp. IS-1556]KUH83381.1 transporter [Mycobacterium sp. GA-0227b]KUH84207.1 transporter [Mycobacterium sp. GA-1999]